jgi:hypothetical protein
MTKKKNYPGSCTASGELQKIISSIPRCDRFIEGMAGSGIVSMTVKGAAGIVVNDIDPSAINKIRLPVGNKENLSYEDLIDKYDYAGPKTVFFFDPPYLLESRSSKKMLYNFNWDKKDHQKFIAKALTVKSNCIILHYPCPLYDKAFKTWRKLCYRSMTHGGVRVKCLYMNFKQPALLLDHRFVGKDYTDRQRIKRKVESLINRLNNLDGQERAAILSAVIDHYDYMDLHKLHERQKRYKPQQLFTGC